MSAASDKARFYLEQSVPELKEFEKKGIFTAEEITSITRKRSDFEHKINARGSTPADFARYAEFEINVDALRRKRVKRLGIKATNHTGKRRIFFVFDRATRKHAGDVDLWMLAIDFARKQKAYKKLQEMLTNVLRLHPTKSALWIYAAQVAVEDNGDMAEARSYMQRGLRFCKNVKNMWLQYARLEMSYIAKIHARREMLGITDQENHKDTQPLDTAIAPTVTDTDIVPQADRHQIDTAALKTLEQTPVKSGAIPMAIFDSAMTQFQDPDLALDFFEMVSDYDQTPTSRIVAAHIEEKLAGEFPQSWQGQACRIRAPVVALDKSDPEFPVALRQSITRLREARGNPSSRKLDLNIRTWLENLKKDEPEMDESIRIVMDSVLKSLQ
ncbi:hypothetical protein PV10_00469 [Exophiala mesophila]|uniref:U3 small nucleolar RNA-associated protein 6 N-terminal domain-containing protein n=1 Tax=Exophiala mesophila TaxID=212818 RepID=A0A0D1X4D2_EXOME|nr:uncharacterized protein PV10_00469 [Exophiala mesophila]KIV96630.1 hypothetical protein PV10_00469 [Exophiala mesophila]